MVYTFNVLPCHRIQAYIYIYIVAIEIVIFWNHLILEYMTTLFSIERSAVGVEPGN
jgi:predicted ABC-type exoprotein transport system permease subunit